jgi:hypothetical protein
MNGKSVVALSFLAVLLPGLLLLPPRWRFSPDWTNHLWLISYFGKYYGEHGSMPAVIHTPQIVGEPVTLFYGNLFYPIMGWLSSWIGTHGAVRLAVFATLGWQFFLVQRVLWSLGSSRNLAWTIACLVTWATYALTNLYNRSAVTEFFAGAWLTCAVCYWFLFLRAGTTRTMLAPALGCALCCILVVGTHPITGWMAVCLFAVLAVTGLLAIHGQQLRRRLLIAGLMALSVTLCLAPWLYATWLFHGDLIIAQSPAVVTIPCVDQWYLRFFPLPLDLRCWLHDPRHVATPYLDTQANMPLLVVIAVWLVKAFRAARHRLGALDLGALGLVLACFGFCILLSLCSSGPYFSLPKPFRAVQFTCRWVNPINLSLLMLLCTVLLIRARGGQVGPPLRLGGLFLSCILGWGFVGLLVKLHHAHFAHDLDPSVNVPLDAQLPMTYYGRGYYSTPALYRDLRDRDCLIQGDFVVDPAKGYGVPQTLHIVSEQSGMLVTRVTAFPWNKLYVNGQAVLPQDIRLWCQPTTPLPTPVEAIPVSPGENVVEYRFEPDSLWRALDLVSRIGFGTVLLGWVVGCGVRVVAARLRPACPNSAAAEPSSI